MNVKANIQYPFDRTYPGRLDYLLICGLGSMGQHCVLALKEFGVSIIAIDNIKPTELDIPNIFNLLDDFIIGDCRQDEILKQARIFQCRAALIVTSDDQINAETALAIRQLNTNIRLVVRSGKEILNQLLNQQLGNFIAYEPSQLSATSLALAALSTETLGLFNLDGQWFRVSKHYLNHRESWCYNRPIYELNTLNRRIISHINSEEQSLNSFYDWQAEDLIQLGDTVIYVETCSSFTVISDDSYPQKKVTKRHKLSEKIHHWQGVFKEFKNLNFQQQLRRGAIFSAMIVLLLLLIGTILFDHYSSMSLVSSFYTTILLLLGNYSDLFSPIELSDDIPWWLNLFALLLTIIGLAFVGVLYALLTEALLTSKFQFTQRRPSVTQHNHVIVVGLGRVGKRVASLLKEFQQSIVGVTFTNDRDFEKNFLPTMPLIFGNSSNLNETLAEANLSTARSLMVLTDDEIFNLEIALMARTINPNIYLVIRTYARGLSQHLNHLLANAQVLGTYSVAAEVFAGAAFGENIISLFPLQNQTVLVTEYQIEEDDTLNGLLLAEVTYGYDLVAILHQKPAEFSTFMPSDDILLSIGDRLVVMATIHGLRRVEQGRLRINLKTWRVRVEKVLNVDAIFEAANIISRVSGCHLKQAREIMENLPQTIPIPLYQHQAQRLIRQLSKGCVKAELLHYNQYHQ